MHFEDNLIFISQDKNLNILRTKRAFKMKQKALFIIVKGLSIIQLFLEGESPTLKIYEVTTWLANNYNTHIA